MLTLSAPDPAGAQAAIPHVDNGKVSIDEQFSLLWFAWSDFRQKFFELRNCFVSLEMTYNYERDSLHPHFHCILIGGFIPQHVLLREWQKSLGLNIGEENNLPHTGMAVDGERFYDEHCSCRFCERGRGRAHINDKSDIKDAIKYPVKGCASTIARMVEGGREERALELMEYMNGTHALRRYGRFIVRLNEEPQPSAQLAAEVDDVVMDQLMVDEETGEVWAPTAALADVVGCGVIQWSWSRWQVECARECLYAARDREPTPDDLQRRERTRRLRLFIGQRQKWRNKQARERRKAHAPAIGVHALYVADGVAEAARATVDEVARVTASALRSAASCRAETMAALLAPLQRWGARIEAEQKAACAALS